MPPLVSSSSVPRASKFLAGLAGILVRLQVYFISKKKKTEFGSFWQLCFGYLSIFRPNRFDREWSLDILKAHKNYEGISSPSLQSISPEARPHIASNSLAGLESHTTIASTPSVYNHDGLAPGPRANATFVILARNSDLAGTVISIREIEDRFNRRYRYPYVFLNDEPFDDKFKE